MRSVIANRAKCRIWSKSCNATIVMHPSMQYSSQLSCYICGEMHARLYFMGLKNLIKAGSCFELSSPVIPACLLISAIAKITWLDVWQVMQFINHFREFNDLKNMLKFIIQNRNTMILYAVKLYLLPSILTVLYPSTYSFDWYSLSMIFTHANTDVAIPCRKMLMIVNSPQIYTHISNRKKIFVVKITLKCVVGQTHIKYFVHFVTSHINTNGLLGWIREFEWKYKKYIFTGRTR